MIVYEKSVTTKWSTLEVNLSKGNERKGPVKLG